MKGLPGLGCGPGECPDKVSWPRDCCKSLQTWPLDVPALPKQVLEVVLMGKADIKEINFHIFLILKNPTCKGAKREFGICLVLGQPSSSSFLGAFPLPSEEEREISVHHKSRMPCGIYKAGVESLPPVPQVSALCSPGPTQGSGADVKLRNSLAWGMAAAVGTTFLSGAS